MADLPYLLGRDNVQIRAIAEIASLPMDSPYRQNALELFSNLKIILESKQHKNVEETELIMNLSPLYLEQIDIATQKGRTIGEATGIERGRVEEGQLLIIRQLTRKLGELNSEQIEQINNLTLDQIESLGDALLDFDLLEDLTSWLSENRSSNNT
jgi:heme oxygenase